MRLCNVRRIVAASAIVLGSSAFTPSARASVWIGAGDGTWGDPLDWSGGVPNGVGAVATFPADAPVTFAGVASPATVGQINFQSSQWLYLIDGPAALTLQASGTNAAQVNVTAGNHVILAPLVLNSDVTFDVAGNANLAVSADISAAGRTIRKQNWGYLSLPYVRANGLTITGGFLDILDDGTAAGLSVVKTLSVSPGQALNLANNAMVVDYAAGSQSPLAAIATRLAEGYHAGKWDGLGIRTLYAGRADQRGITGLGYAEASAVGVTNFFGQQVDGSAVLIRYTYYGDANLDGVVNAADFARINNGYLNGLSGWSNGDFNFDGRVTAGDFALAQLALALQGSVPLASIPEPTAIGAGVVAMGTVVARRERRG